MRRETPGNAPRMRRAFAGDTPEKQPKPISFNFQLELDSNSTRMCIEPHVTKSVLFPIVTWQPNKQNIHPVRSTPGMSQNYSGDAPGDSGNAPGMRRAVAGDTPEKQPKPISFNFQ